MSDSPGTGPPRFPESLRDRARKAILEKLQPGIARTAEPVLVIASGQMAETCSSMPHAICPANRITRFVGSLAFGRNPAV